MTDIRFEPESWLRSGRVLGESGVGFHRAAQAVLSTTAATSHGATTSNPVDVALTAVLAEVTAHGTEVVASIEQSVASIGTAMIATGVVYAATEASQAHIASRAVPGDV